MKDINGHLGALLSPCSRDSRHRSETRNAGTKLGFKEGSNSGGSYDVVNQHIVIIRIFSERPRSGSSKGEGHSPGTPTMFIKIYACRPKFRGRGQKGLRGGV